VDSLKAGPTPGLVPVPDPTTLTNELVTRAVMALREILETRLDANDKALRVLVKTSEELAHEKFRAIEGMISTNRKAWEDRFELLDKQTIKAASDVKSAVDAAFAAAASGVAQQNQANFLASQKQEAAFTKQIDQLAAVVSQIAKASDDKVTDLKKNNDERFGDLKDRIIAMENRTGGARDQQGVTSNLIFSILGVAGVVGLIIVDFMRR
jgi:hypothetical protein